MWLTASFIVILTTVSFPYTFVISNLFYLYFHLLICFFHLFSFFFQNSLLSLSWFNLSLIVSFAFLCKWLLLYPFCWRIAQIDWTILTELHCQFSCTIKVKNQIQDLVRCVKYHCRGPACVLICFPYARIYEKTFVTGLFVTYFAQSSFTTDFYGYKNNKRQFVKKTHYLHV